MDDSLLVAVLAGGEGRRMGGVKALRPFRGTTLVAHALSQARRWSPQVCVVVRQADQVAAAVEAALVFDDPAIAGPLAGLAAALAEAQARGCERLLTLPVDMPNLPPELPARLAAALTPGIGAALPEAAGYLQATCGLWRAAALDGLPAYRLTGASSLRGFAAACGLATVAFDETESSAFANANSPEELERLAAGRP